MAKRVGVILSGCGARDGSDVAETLLALLILDRAGAEAVVAAPDAVRADVARMLPRAIEVGEAPGAGVLSLSALDARDIDALIIPGGAGAGTVLSDYAEKGQVCQVHPDVSRLLRALLPARRPMGFLGLASVLAARVLGPVAGVRVTFGPKAATVARHAAVMGADVRPATVEDLIVDQKARVFSTAGFLAEGAHLAAVARAVDKLTRGMLQLARDRSPVSVDTGTLKGSPRPPATGAGERGSPPPTRPDAGTVNESARPPATASGERGSIEPTRRRPTGRARGSA